jgi:ParB family chromosome partitioning protein
VAEARLSAGHARALLATPNRNLQERLARRAVDEQWTVRQLEQALRPDVEPEPGASEAARPPAGTPAGAIPARPPRGEAQRGAELADRSEPGPAGPAESGTGGPQAPERRGLGAEPDVVRALPPAGLLELEQLLADHLDTVVKVNAGRGRGRITVEFADLADLERIYRLMVEGD